MQPALPKYRVPVFREMASRGGIDFRLLYGEEPGLKNVPADGFVAESAPMRHLRLRGQPLFWQSAQTRSASRDVADVLGMTWNTRYMSGWPALRLARLRGVPTLLWGHGYSKNESEKRFRLRVRMGKEATAVLLYNHTAAERVIEAGIPRERVFVALNALDQGPIQSARERWISEPARLEAFRREAGLEGGKVVLFVSRLDPANRVDLLLQAAAKIKDRHGALRVVIVGNGPDLDRLRAMAGTLGIAANVQFPGAIYDEDRLAGYFLASRVFCYPANIGLSILHAFGYGVPVVTGNDIASHNPEIEAIREGENGLLFRHDDADSLAQVLDRQLGDADLSARLGAGAHRTVMERFTLKNMVDGMEAAVRYCAASRAR
ncbi:MAG: glycosyltransferase family 4 protein [Phycisphaeraceae bacterium]|nr:glycosyltransferase family 4 protein [Phycisphaeraceae bacterium]